MHQVLICQDPKSVGGLKASSCIMADLSRYFAHAVAVNACPHGTTVAYDSSLWRMRLSRKSTVAACYSLANVAIGRDDCYG